MYDTQKNKIVEKLSGRNDTENVAKAVYNFGYIPESLKCYLIYKRIIDKSKSIKFECTATRSGQMGNTVKDLNEELKREYNYENYSDINKCYINKLNYDYISNLMNFIINNKSYCYIDVEMLEYIKRIVIEEFSVYNFNSYIVIVFDKRRYGKKIEFNKGR